jgi:succinyl-diaminopimelate desuccinylase
VEVSDQVLLPPLDTEVDDPFVGIVRAALAASGLADEVASPARFFTDASVLAGLLGNGTPAASVVLGPGEPAQCHVVDEFCLAERVEQAAVVYRELLERWCGAA